MAACLPASLAHYWPSALLFSQFNEIYIECQINVHSLLYLSDVFLLLLWMHKKELQHLSMSY